MVLGGMTICWCSSVKYLGVHLLCGRFLKFDIMPAKRAFYAAYNSIFIYGADVDELALLSLQESYKLSTWTNKRVHYYYYYYYYYYCGLFEAGNAQEHATRRRLRVGG